MRKALYNASEFDLPMVVIIGCWFVAAPIIGLPILFLGKLWGVL
jgi:hypothetical protein